MEAVGGPLAGCPFASLRFWLCEEGKGQGIDLKRGEDEKLDPTMGQGLPSSGSARAGARVTPRSGAPPCSSTLLLAAPLGMDWVGTGASRRTRSSSPTRRSRGPTAGTTRTCSPAAARSTSPPPTTPWLVVAVLLTFVVAAILLRTIRTHRVSPDLSTTSPSLSTSRCSPSGRMSASSARRGPACGTTRPARRPRRTGPTGPTGLCRPRS